MSALGGLASRLIAWLMVCMGIALPGLALAQPNADLTAPDYAHGYERLMVPRFDTEPALNPPLLDDSSQPRYRFRGDPPPSGFSAPDGVDSALRFRPLTPTERERVGPATRWRPTDDERQPALDTRPERATLFEHLTPNRAPPPAPWAGERD